VYKKHGRRKLAACVCVLWSYPTLPASTIRPANIVGYLRFTIVIFSIFLCDVSSVHLCFLLFFLFCPLFSLFRKVAYRVAYRVAQTKRRHFTFFTFFKVIKLTRSHLLLYVVFDIIFDVTTSKMPKIITFCRCIHLLQAKM